MTKNYCGKTCTECTLKDALDCPGCKAGPGQVGGECELSKCCRSKGHNSCDSCNIQIRCSTFKSRERIPEYRLQMVQAQAEQEAAIARRAPRFHRLLRILFWLIIPGILASILTNSTVSQWLPTLYIPGVILNAACVLVYGIILLFLTPDDFRYRTAGICQILAGVISLVTIFLPSDSKFLTLGASAVTLICTLISQYRECNAHAAILAGADNYLSDKWSVLWKWWIGMYAAMFGSIFVAIISPLLSIILILAAAIGILVVFIVKQVYLYQSAKVFQCYL